MTNPLPFPIIDTHAHVGTLHNAPEGEPFRPAEELLTLMDQHGVQTTVLIPYLGYTNHRYIAECLARFPKRFAGVEYVDWRREDACHVLAESCRSGQFRGLRLECHARSPNRDALAIWKTADALGLRMSAQGGRSPAFWAEGLGEVLNNLPHLSVRIEHLARPRPELGVNDAAFQAVLRLADFRNVTMNIDGLWAVSRAGRPYDDVWPFAEAALAAFGPERLMWGSDFPYLLEFQQYGDGYSEIAPRFADKPASFSERIFYRTPAEFWAIG